MSTIKPRVHISVPGVPGKPCVLIDGADVTSHVTNCQIEVIAPGVASAWLRFAHVTVDAHASIGPQAWRCHCGHLNDGAYDADGPSICSGCRTEAKPQYVEGQYALIETSALSADDTDGQVA